MANGCLDTLFGCLGIVTCGVLVIGCLTLAGSAISTCSDSIESWSRKRDTERLRQEYRDPSSVRRWKVVNGKLRRDYAAERSAQGQIEQQRRLNQDYSTQYIIRDLNEAQKWQCDNCERVNPSGSNNCIRCGFTILCPSCNKRNHGLKKCSNCGELVQEPHKY